MPTLRRIVQAYEASTLIDPSQARPGDVVESWSGNLYQVAEAWTGHGVSPLLLVSNPDNATGALMAYDNRNLRVIHRLGPHPNPTMPAPPLDTSHWRAKQGRKSLRIRCQARRRPSSAAGQRNINDEENQR